MTGWSASVWWPATTLHITERVEALSGLRSEANSVVEDLDSGRPLVIGRGQAAWDQWRREKIPCEAPIVRIECMYIKEDWGCSRIPSGAWSWKVVDIFIAIPCSGRLHRGHHPRPQSKVLVSELEGFPPSRFGEALWLRLPRALGLSLPVLGATTASWFASAPSNSPLSRGFERCAAASDWRRLSTCSKVSSITSVNATATHLLLVKFSTTAALRSLHSMGRLSFRISYRLS